MRKYVMSLMLLCVCMANAADRRWALKTQAGETVLMDQVGYILHSDGSSVMSIVKTDNTAIENVTGISFVQTDATDISQTVKDNGISVLSRVVSGNLTVSGCAAGLPLSVMSASGVVIIKTTTADGRTDVDVSRLASGVYLLNVGKTIVKFIKK